MTVPTLSARRDQLAELDAASHPIDALLERLDATMDAAFAAVARWKSTDRASDEFKADRLACRAELADLTSCPTHGQFRTCASVLPRTTELADQADAHLVPREPARCGDGELARDALTAGVEGCALPEGPTQPALPPRLGAVSVARRAVPSPVDSPAAPETSGDVR